jgi:LPXTG-motif cell wall-anchored protein
VGGTVVASAAFTVAASATVADPALASTGADIGAAPALLALALLLGGGGLLVARRRIVGARRAQ